MRIRRLLESPSLQLAILRGAAWLVPGGQRTEWLAEWRSELTYVRQACRRGPHGGSSGGATSFCLGAFPDALWLRRNTPSGGLFRWESPVECLLFLTVLAVASLFLAWRLPVARDLLLPSPYRDAPDLVMVYAHRHAVTLVPTIPIEQYQAWINSTRGRFTGLAFYQPVLCKVPIAPRHTALMTVARTSGHLFDLLKISVPSLPLPDERENRTALILSRRAWRKYFDSDPRIVGRVLDIDGQRAVVSGILEEGSWRLPDRVDAWLIEDDQHLDRLPAESRGFVLAHLRTSGPGARPQGPWHLPLPNREGGFSNYDCVSLADRMQNPFGNLLLLAVATWLVLRAFPSMALGGYPSSRDSARLPIRLRRWAFFATKIALLFPIAILGALDLEYLLASIAGVHIEGLAVPAAWFLAVRWLLRDQRQRCPVCLRLLINPVGIGQASQTFLGWYGTELMCAKGHGLLHVPEIPTSSSSATRWIQLDPSWSGLF